MRRDREAIAEGAGGAAPFPAPEHAATDTLRRVAALREHVEALKDLGHTVLLRPPDEFFNTDSPGLPILMAPDPEGEP